MMSIDDDMHTMTMNDVDDLDPSNSVVGICMIMCPDEEMVHRSKQFVIHPLEATTATSHLNQRSRICDPTKMVKCYSRPAAGKEFSRAEILRPFRVLKTTNYYLLNLAMTSQHPWDMVYEFVSDRFRAVRQDIIIQQLDARESLELLSEMLPFYFYAKYRCEIQGCSTYDSRLHASQMDECVDRCLAAFMSELRLRQIKSPSTPSFLRLLILYRLNSDSFWSIILSTPVFNLVRSTCVRFLHLKWILRTGNYALFFRKFRKLPPSERLALSSGLNMLELRKRILWTMKLGYGRSKIPLEKIIQLLALKNSDDAVSCVQDYGFEVNDAGLVDLSTNNQQSIGVGRSLACHWYRWPDDDLRDYKLF